MDFSQLPLPKVAKAPTDPFKIFASLPRLEGAPNDLWRGQADALQAWDKARGENDVLVSLNTGAGKTIVGLLIAKSFCNEGLDNVLYLCPTIDLVLQTAREARSIGIEVTTRIDRDFDNDLFESGKTFCITSYAAAFNGHSALRRKYFPDAVIFDDAHVAEVAMRDAFTLRIKSEEHKELFSDIAAIYRQHFARLNREGVYLESLDPNRHIAQSALVPPDVVSAAGSQIAAILKSRNVAGDKSLTYPYEHLKDHLDQCAVVFRGGVVEITPPFLPSLALDIFEQRVRRVYLSATLHNKADIIRAFGREPAVSVEPANDAGNGERLIIFERGLKSDKFDADFAERLKRKHKLVVAIPGYYRQKFWEKVAVPPKREDFTRALEEFRRASSGAFILVSRVDGIDLPNDTCRLMLIDDLPKSDSALEKYQFEFLHMRKFSASRIANRLVQLFGRINRGRSDYGAFLISGRELNAWLNNDKNVALLPDLLKNQILLGRHVQDHMSINGHDAVDTLLDTVLLSKPRNQTWLDFYGQYLEAQEIDREVSEGALKAEERNLKAAKAEAEYAKQMWARNYAQAREALDSVVSDVARSDEKLAGWLNLWIGAALAHENSPDDAQLYFERARSQLGMNLVVDVSSVYSRPPGAKPLSAISIKIDMLTRLGRESFEKQFGKMQRSLEPLHGGSPSQMEEATRYLGELIGFETSRPDNELNTGPDVLWIDANEKSALGLELKTDKLPESEYSKSETSQALDHLSWLQGNVGDNKVLGVVLIGPDAGVSSQANPTSEIYSIKRAPLIGISERLLAIIRDVYAQPADKRVETAEIMTGDEWTMSSLAKILCSKPLA